MSRVLAFDLGASSGRAMLGEYEDGKIRVEELHRFSNDPVLARGTLYWDVLRLFYEMRLGILKAVRAGGFDSVGIDTWGVDYALIRPDGHLIGNPVHYRDKRTDDYEMCQVTPEEAYKITGIEIIYFNTIYQLNAVARKAPHVLADAGKLLFMPDFFNYLLCGSTVNEYTIASTSEMLNAKTRDWDTAIIRKAGISEHILCEIAMPGTVAGVLNPEICTELGAGTASVMNVASHDTASAVAAIPTQEKDFIFMSCGTWCLLGTVLDEPLINEKAFRYNFTNEGTVDGKIQFMKNIMGTWLIQESRRQWAKEGAEYSFGELEEMAQKAEPFRCFIDPDDSTYTKPGDVPGRIRAFCEKTGQHVPETPGEIVRCIDESLALKFRYVTDCLTDCTAKEYKTLNILGGGTQSKLLCQMSANATGLSVIAGPVEATVLGNIGVQLIGRKEIAGIKEFRAAVAASTDLAHYEPQETAAWDDAYATYSDLILGGTKA